MTTASDLAVAARSAVAPAASPPGSRLRWAISDAVAIAIRNLTHLKRVPQLLIFATIQPVIFVLMFRYVFGGAISAPGYAHYVDYLMPGIFAQTVAFGAVSTGVGLADDLGKGLLERFRSLPMARSAVLAGRTLADLVRNVLVVSLMCLVGFMVGFRVQTNPLAFVAAIGIMLLFAFSLSWIFAVVGLATKDPESAQAAAFPFLAPLVFASSSFVPLRSMPGWLQVFAARQPVTITVDAVRALTHGGPTLTPVLQSIAWSIGLVAVFAPFAVRMYRKAA